MKSLTIGLILLFAFQASFSQGTSTAKIPDIPFVNHIYGLAADNTIIELEQADAHYMMKPPVPFQKQESGYSIHGDQSPVRLKGNDSLRFVIKMASSSMDPSFIIRLYQLKGKKGNRDAVLNSSQDMYYHNKNEDNSAGIRLNYQKAANDVFIIIPAMRLPAGEYGFMNTTLMNGGGMHATYTLFAFGLNP
ncbi:MAG: hypothetical protein ACHQEM_02340 [Chitinophagales bacterium]